ncbi:hypothetical protein QAD02_022269 [Eretmocerus hayati]|uniref:Uncharacterized protein n=1 Tax=Eretmocerus hayati TaxID=131215 RepID=A0ACC2PXE4_9HYME|nr:hypothetical protein QAD02_022269 [Eretmocerus hayati]
MSTPAKRAKNLQAMALAQRISLANLQVAAAQFNEFNQMKQQERKASGQSITFSLHQRIDSPRVGASKTQSMTQDKPPNPLVTNSNFPLSLSRSSEVVTTSNDQNQDQNIIFKLPQPKSNGLSDEMQKSSQKAGELVQLSRRLHHPKVIPNDSDFGAYLTTKSFSDVVLVADADRKFYAHKIILAKRSPYFAQLFAQNEDKRSMVEITDVKGDILAQVLKFIYSGRVDNFENITSELCVAAEKFSLEHLKNQCTQYLTQNLNIDKAASILAIASANNMPGLKKTCISFINRHAKEVIKTVGYTDLVTNFPLLVDELYRESVMNPLNLEIVSPFSVMT